MRNRAPRCHHGFLAGLCVVATCAHFDDGEPPSAALPPAHRTRSRSGPLGALVRAALLASPKSRNGVIAAECGCSSSLVSAIRQELGLGRRKR